jgi:ADP-ribose pyrophosphatase
MTETEEHEVQHLGVEPTTGVLWEFGPNYAVDAVVLATTLVGQRWLLMVLRRDRRKWALPGGFVETGRESVFQAAARELTEETGLDPVVEQVALMPRLVPDPRCTPWAWIVTTPVVFDLGVVGDLPVVEGGDDAAEAAWMPAADFAELDVHLGGDALYDAHRPMLRDLLA